MSDSEEDANESMISTTLVLPGADITCNNQQLFEALKDDNLELFQELTSQLSEVINKFVLDFSGGDAPWMLRSQPTIPFVAAYFGATQIFDYILVLDIPDLEIRDKAGRDLFQFVVAGGSLDILKSLDSKGAFQVLKHADYRGNTIIHYAAKYGRFDILKWLYLHGVKEFTTRNESGATPFMWACGGGNIDMVNFFLEHGAKVNELTLFGRVLNFYF